MAKAQSKKATKGGAKVQPGAKKRRVGRPTLFKPEYLEQAEKLCKLGATDKELADFFGVQESTLSLWKSKHSEFMEALKRGKIIADANVADRLYQRAMGYSHESEKIFNNEGVITRAPFVEHYAPDTTAAIFWLKNRQREKWRDGKDITTGGEKLPPPLPMIKTIEIVHTEWKDDSSDNEEEDGEAADE